MCNKCKTNNCGCGKIEFSGCKTKQDLLCSLYTGETLETLDIKAGTDGNTVLKKINDYLELKEDSDPIILDNVGDGLGLFKGISDNYKYDFKSIIKGDAKCYSISAASIIAKVTRDRIMRQWDEIYPQYGFAKHKGYGTAEHIKALKEYGPCPLHRESFIKHFV